ncbi:MAG TPA: LPS export ABC transporter periplasmic protein LptC [Ignavibacteria bacterium]|nr:LPS export ABC transporter periplasmic protein LptC [Ignavibacteria bacterium]
MFSVKKVFFLLFILCGSIIIGCGEGGYIPQKTDFTAGDSPDQQSWNATVSFSDSNQVIAILKAKYIAYYSQKGLTIIDSGAVVDFFKEGKNVSTLTGKRGVVHDDTKNIEMQDSVKIRSVEGNELITQKLLWTNKTRRVSSEEYVKITTAKEIIEGIGFESDQELKNYTIYKVTGTFSK